MGIQLEDTVICHTDRADHNKDSLDRLRRIQGQLASLARLIEADEGTCEDRIVRARTVEKGMRSLITHLVECHLENTARPLMDTDADAAMIEITRIVQLLNK